MDWSIVLPTAITGVVGLAGIAGSIISARQTSKSASRDLRLSIKAEDTCAGIAEKRRIYAAFNAAIEGLWIVVTSSENFTLDPGRLHYNQAMTLLWSNYYEVRLVASGGVSSLAHDVTEMMTQLASELLKDRDEYLKVNRGHYEPSGFNEKREGMVNEMCSDLSGELR